MFNLFMTVLDDEVRTTYASLVDTVNKARHAYYVADSPVLFLDASMTGCITAC